MKKIMSILLSILLVLPVSAIDNITLQENIWNAEQHEVISVVEDYLIDSAYALYLSEDCHYENHTIESVIEENYNEIALLANSYQTFRNVQANTPYLETDIVTGNVSSFIENLNLNSDRITFYRYLHELDNITYTFFTPTYNAVECSIDGNLATVNIYESLDFQYSDCDEPSYILTHYFISLMKIDNNWYIASVESDDEFYSMYHNTGFDLETQMQGVKEAHMMPEMETISTQSHIAAIHTASTLTDTDRPYIGQNAANYALTYSTQSDDEDKIPSFTNTLFWWDDESCQLFASQCVWAGLGGSNDETSINAKQGMDSSGNNTWWSTSTGATNSWASPSYFKTYVDTVSNSNSETGVVCDTYMVSHNSNDMGSSIFTASDLVGAVLHGHNLGHAVVVNKADGLTRDKVYQTSYNYCRKNIKVSLSNPSSTTDTSARIYIIVPRYLRGDSTIDTNYLYADLLNSQVLKNGSVTATLSAHAASQISNLQIDVYGPGDTRPKESFDEKNTTDIEVDYTFNKAGEWKIVVSGTGLESYTYVVRVV